MPMLDGGPPWTAIRTPDQRLRVFVSSTLEELATERGAAPNDYYGALFIDAKQIESTVL
jgi:hypothetical protein